MIKIIKIIEIIISSRCIVAYCREKSNEQKKVGSRPSKIKRGEDVGKGRKWLWDLIINMLFNWLARTNC